MFKSPLDLVKVAKEKIKAAKNLLREKNNLNPINTSKENRLSV